MPARARRPSPFLRFLNGLPKGYIFTSRDLIPFAPRTTIDSALSRLVKGGTLERLARGVFRFFAPSNRKVSDRQLAAIKRRAFGRKIATVATAVSRNCIERLNDTGREKLKPSDVTLVSDGRASSFLNHQDRTRINCKSVAMRIKGLGESLAGRALRDLWLLGNGVTCSNDVITAWRKLPPREVAKVPSLKRLLPDWLVRLLPPTPTHVLEQLMIRPVKRIVVFKPLPPSSPSGDDGVDELEEKALRLRQAKEINDWLDEIENGDIEFP
ncbi:MAG: type IV toxin-antitoxin system AbiEi family antitoxin domain-containing protein [Candidatus Obscuribacter sp.]|nr:type IV toxin-antitoxin system AbiEi family antitoxin domain-containing protein [Candidatus Obscuribacter sp.]